MTLSIAEQMAVESYVMPASIEEALHLASEFGGGSEFIAGGTDSILHRKSGLTRTSHIIDLTGIRELAKLQVSGTALEIGALCTLNQLASAPEIANHSPLIAEAAASIATPVIRKSATIGGNLLVSNRCTYFNQSKFWRNSIGSCLRDVGDTCLVTGVHGGKCFSRNVSDLAPALIVLDAVVVIRSAGGELILPLADLYVQDGLRPISLSAGDSILTQIRVSHPAKAWGYRKLRLRNSLDFASLTAAASVDQRGTFRICLNGIAMAPIMVNGKITDLSLEHVKRQLRLKAKVVNNDLLPLEYRKEMMNTFVEELWNELTTPEHKI